MPLWRALRVVAGRGGEGRSVGPRGAVRRPRPRAAPRQGRSSTPSADERRAHLVSVIGIAGIGKSRLAWEFEKYVDGLADDVYWHRGRCLSYGDGVAYWALAEMVRMRCADRRGRGRRRPRSRSSARRSSEHVPDAEERALGRAAARAPARARRATRASTARTSSPPGGCSSSGSPSSGPTVLVFEDMQWADAGLLDFVEYLLEWSRSHPIFVLALARPELAERRPTWGAGAAQLHVALARAALATRRWTSCSTGSSPASRTMLREHDPRRGPRASRSTRSRRCGCCSTAACSSGTATSTGRPARSRRSRCRRRCTRSIAARLDGLDARGAAPAPGRRRARQDVHRARARRAVAASHEDELEPLLAALVRKEVLVAPGRSALARARPVRLPPGPRPARRLRDARAHASARRATSRRPRYLADAARASTRTRSPR